VISDSERYDANPAIRRWESSGLPRPTRGAKLAQSKRRTRTVARALTVIIVAVVFCFAALGTAAQSDDALAVYRRGSYATALRLWRPLPDQGDANAQYHLGVMYALGQAGPRDAVESVRWYRRAAEQGHARAQFMLGVMYNFGDGVPRDYALAYMWFDLATSRGSKDGAKNRDDLADRMIPAKHVEAQKLARDWKAKRD
jgi:TPR repeat protein